MNLAQPTGIGRRADAGQPDRSASSATCCMARIVGAGFASDAFFVAFRLPNMFRAPVRRGRLLGRRSSRCYSQRLQARRRRRGASVSPRRCWRSSCRRCSSSRSCSIAAHAGRSSAAISGYATASSSPSRTLLTRITIPYLMLISLASLLGGILNSLARFWGRGLAPILLNLAMIVALSFFHGTAARSRRPRPGDLRSPSAACSSSPG